MVLATLAVICSAFPEEKASLPKETATEKFVELDLEQNDEAKDESLSPAASAWGRGGLF